MRTCVTCRQPKAESEFYTREGGARLRRDCKKCCNARTSGWRRANPGRKRKASPEVARRAYMKYRYGVSPEQYDAMLAQQNGRCAICRDQPAGRLHVDHCHATRAVRGLLCGHCNRMIGLAKDSPATLISAAAYLKAGALLGTPSPYTRGQIAALVVTVEAMAVEFERDGACDYGRIRQLVEVSHDQAEHVRTLLSNQARAEDR